MTTRGTPRLGQLAKARWLLPLVGVIVLFLIFTLLVPDRFTSSRNLQLIFRQSVVLMIAGLGMSFVMSQGSIDISQGSMLVLCESVAAAIVAATGASGAALLPVIIPTCMLVGMACGLFNGLFVARVRIPSFAVTIATMMIFRNMAVAILNKRCVVVPISHIGSFTTMLVGFILVFLMASYLFDYNAMGKYSKAIGSNETAAGASGVPVLRTKLMAFIFSGLCVGIAAPFHIARLGLCSPKAGSFFEFDVITALVIGGTPLTGGSSSRVYSVIIGGLIVGMLSNGLTLLGVDPVIKDLVKGAILIAAVALSLERGKLVTIK